jgi:hypothetical protein
VAQGDEITGFLGGLYACNACNAEHIAFFGGAALNQSQGRGQHHNAARRYAHPFGVGLVGHIHHMGLALCIKMSECGHAEINKGLT